MSSQFQLNVAVLRVLALIAVLACASFTQAQTQPADTAAPQLTPQVANNDTPTDDETKLIEDFTNYWFGQVLAGADTESVARGRREIVTILTGRGTSEFVADLMAASLNAQLPKALDSDQTYVRLNALIIASISSSDTITDLSVKALADSDWPIRYWGAKAYGEVITRLGSVPAGQQAVIDAMVAAAATEDSEAAYSQYVLTLAILKAAGVQAVSGPAQIDILTQRVAIYSTGITTGIATDLILIDEAHQSLVQALSSNQSVDSQLRDLLAAVARLMLVSATQLQGDPLPADLQAIVKEQVAVTETIFGFGITTFNAIGKDGPSLGNPFNSGNYGELLLNLYDWMGIDASEPGVLTKELGVPGDKLFVK